MLIIKRKIVDRIVEHGRREAPLEACGYLAAENGEVCKHVEMKNIDASPIHYSMDPEQQFAAVKHCREEGLAIRAVYHSHPETAAYPSQEDIKLAYDPSLSYVIVSLANSEPSIRAFIIKKDKVYQEQIKIIGEQK